MATTVFLFANNAFTTLAAGISNVATTCTLATGTGTLFPNPGSGQQFALTFTDALTGLVNEIVYCTARSGDVLTIVRAQEGTAAVAWLAGDNASNLMTAGTGTQWLQIGQGYAVDTGTNAAMVVTLFPVPTSYTQLIGVPIRVKAANTLVAGATLNVNGLGAKNLIRAGSGSIFGSDWGGGSILTCVYDGTNIQVQELAVAAAMGSSPGITTAVPNGGVATTIATIGQTANTNYGAFSVHFQDGGGNNWSAIVTANAGDTPGTSTPSTLGSPGTVAFTTVGTLLKMTRTGGPASVPVTVTQLCA